MTSYETLAVSVGDGLARIAINRPGSRNSLSLQTLDDLIAICAEIEDRDDIRVVVFEGKGRAFSVGFDLNAMAAMMTHGLPDRAAIEESAKQGKAVVDAIQNLNAVTIASVHGYAIGGGFLIMAACDFRVAADNTVFSIPEVDIGLPLAWGGVPLLISELGRSHARKYILTCRPFGPADLAQTGFIHYTVEPHVRVQAALELADELLAKPPVALKLAKSQFRPGNTPDDTALFADAILHPDFLNAAMAYVQRIRAK